uniref:Sosondowah ankyrin repeat domain family Cb n=1 Tax=Astyanax mexicanus TaxID=7994 RepID=W5KKK3_ASTMX
LVAKAQWGPDECTQEAVLRFLTERGGRARNVDLIEHFRSAIPTEPGKKSAAKEAFKGYVDSVAVVKVDNGEKYVCLNKKFRGGLVGGDRDDQTAPTGPLDLQSESDQKISQWLRRKQSGVSQRGGEQSADEGPFIDINTPKGSRKNFLEHMMSSSPQVRRSMALRSSVYLSNRCKDSARSDGDATSLNSSSGNNMYYENASVALEPLEHEWMMCASDGEWESLQRLLATEPGLVGKKDFVTGFTCLHWAAKLGKAELLALLVSFATQRGVPVDVNARSSAGYTPLKLLVGAYDADVEVRDYSGRKASQYMKSEVAHDVLDIVGAISEADAEVQRTDGGEASGWRLSRVLQANLRPLKLLNHSASEDDVSTVGENAGLVKEKVLRRKTSLRGLRPRLSKIRTRTQIVHSTSLSGHFEREAVETSGSFRSRPKSNLFG